MPQAKKPATTPSLPGANSTRTDGGIASKQAQRYIAGMPNYGDGQEMMDLQASAPMARTMNQPASAGMGQGQPQGQTPNDVQPIRIDAPSQFPGQHVTDASGIRNPVQDQNNGLLNALTLLNQLGDSVSPQVTQIRNALSAHLNNQRGNQ